MRREHREKIDKLLRLCALYRRPLFLACLTGQLMSAHMAQKNAPPLNLGEAGRGKKQKLFVKTFKL